MSIYPVSVFGGVQMTYEGILQKAILDINFRDDLLYDPIVAIKKHSIAVTEETIAKLKCFSLDKFNNFLELLTEEKSGPNKGYM